MDSDPSSYSRRVLLAVAGLSPQIVTETLYALCRAADAFIPTEVRLITTSEGAERARLSLLSADLGWFRQLLDDYDLPAIAFDLDHIEVVADADGRPLSDIRTAADNQRVADQITATVRDLTADADCALHVSIAGGRKTMGYYAGYALSLFGRPQDRLSHVLVSDPFESSWQFFYPTPYSRIIATRDDKLVDTKDARVTLAPVPFVSMRDGLPEPLRTGRASFSETIAAAQRALRPPELVLDLPGQRLLAAGQALTMSPAPLAFYAVFARRLLDSRGAARHDSNGFVAQYLAELRRISGPHAGNVAKAEQTYANGMDEDQFQLQKTRANAALRAALGAQYAAPYLIDDDGERPLTRYQLRLPATAVRFFSSEEPEISTEHLSGG